MKTMYDPPSGWMYGFPKPLPDNRPADWNFERWLIESGYPEKDLELALKYGRYWKVDDSKVIPTD